MADEDTKREASTVCSLLAPAQLLRRCDDAALPFATTAELDGGAEVIGQQRAIEAIELAVGIGDEGYNLYAMGAEGVGRRTLARRFLEREARLRPAPDDWCYVYNFRVPHRPVAIALPPGRGRAFKTAMERLLDDLRAAIPAAFEADEYRIRKQEIANELGEREQHGIAAVGDHAKAQGIGLLRTPGGFGFAPIVDGEVMPPERYEALPAEERARIDGAISALQGELEIVIGSMPKWRREAQHKFRELDREVTRSAINSLLDEPTAEFGALPGIGEYLAAMREDVLDHAQLFLQPKDGEPTLPFGLTMGRPEGAETALRRYAVNLLIDHADSAGAPIVYEDNPTHDNLVGRIEHIAQLGALVTDFTLIKAGVLHRANGGYLILDALKLLTQPLAWDALKRALRSHEVRTETLGQALGLISTQSLEPQPIPLDVKVVLVGQPALYYLLHAADPDFAKLFRVAADFEPDIERSVATESVYARLVAAMAKRSGLRPFDRLAVARVIEHASRRSGSAERLSVVLDPLVEVLAESNHCAGRNAHDVIGAADVEAALAARVRRAERLPERVRDEMLRERLLVATDGERVGQINGLSVVELGGFAFGVPVRITARAHLGGGNVVDIERESELGGPIHAKGVLILAGYLAAHYAPNRPLSLAASLVFEQTYGPIEGDSASSAELYALLSALADVPLSNAYAVTGSVNQHGDVQAIGGVNEKLEGWFDLCSRRGLTGRQGALIPTANVSQLMLRQDIVDAVAQGRFAIHAVDTVDRGLAILTGMPAGTRDAWGRFPPRSLNARIEERLAAFAERARSAAAPVARRGAHRARDK